MVSERLARHPAYVRGELSARQFALGRNLALREEGLEGLGLGGFALDVARKVIAHDDWGPRAVGLQAAATYHAQLGEGALAAAIAAVVRALFEAAAEKAPEEIRGIARQAIASTATDFSYGVLRAGFPDDAVAWADALTPKLLEWGKTDAGLTVEVLAAEALYTTNRFDAAIARLPTIPPSDDAGRNRHERLRGLLADLRPEGEPRPPSARYAQCLAALSTLHRLLPDTPAYGAIRRKIAAALAEEAGRGLPASDDELLERATSLIDVLNEARQFGAGHA
jgi:hypothetical protein